MSFKDLNNVVHYTFNEVARARLKVFILCHFNRIDWFNHKLLNLKSMYDTHRCSRMDAHTK